MLVVLALLGILAASALLSRGSALRQDGQGLVIGHGADALASEGALEPVDADSLRLRIPEGSVMRADAAFKLTNPSRDPRHVDLRMDVTMEGVRAQALVRGEPAGALVLLPGETIDVGLLVEAGVPAGSRTLLTFIVRG